MSLFNLKKKLGAVRPGRIKVPPGRYPVILKTIAEIPTACGPSIKFGCRILEPEEYEGQIVTGLADPDMEGGSKLLEWLEAFRGGKTFDIGEIPDLENYINKRAIVKVKLSEKKYPSQPVFSNIYAIYPVGTPGPVGPFEDK